MSTGDEAVAIHQRSDVCAVPAAGVVVETMARWCLHGRWLEKFGGDSLAETKRNYRVLPAGRGRAGTASGESAPKAPAVRVTG